ncbi:MAG TPA: O-antigen ligase family protein [Gaiellaceae bacterium]|nr:O-antigen ligase family protein [Gaiellaceae bacterium]
MAVIRELRSPLGAALALTAALLFFSSGSDSGSLTWIGGAAVVVLVILVALYGFPRRSLALLPLAALAVWCAASIAWSIEADRSWDYANRTFLYLVFALVGTYLAGRVGQLALGFAALLGAVCFWSLLAKVVPALHEDYGRIARLVGPIGYWNALALLGDIALPIGLWLAGRSRVAGTLLVYGWLVAIVLTYSRSGVAIAVVAIAGWIVFSRLWIEALTTLVAAGVPAAGVLGLAFRLDGVTKDGQTHAARVHDGWIFGAALLVGGLLAVALSRLPRPEATPSLQRSALLLVGVIAAIALAVGAVRAQSWWDTFTSSSPTELSNSSGRLTSAGSNHRWVWWQEAWKGWKQHGVSGTGAGSFEFTNLKYRTSGIDNTTEPHSLPLQFLTETGLAGFALFLAAMLALVLGARRRSDAELALWLALPVYLLQGLLDINWDFAAVTGPVFLIAGALVAAPIPERRVSPFGALIATGLALVLLASLSAVWLANRWVGDSESALTNPAHAITLAKRARSVDPLSVSAVEAEALAWTVAAGSAPTHKVSLLDYNKAYSLYLKWTQLQPEDPNGWLSLGEFALGRNCPQKALPAFERGIVLDPYNSDYAAKDKALKLVNSGKAVC